MNLRRVLCAAASILLVVAFAGSALAQDTLKIGAMFSQTGTGSAVGKIQVEAVKLAIKEVNDKGGVTVGGKKMKVEAVLRDDETKPDVAVRRLREYQNDGVNLLVAGTFAHVSQALNEQVKSGQTFVIVPNGIQEKTFEKAEKAPYFGSTMGGVDAIGRICGDYVAKTYKPKSVVLFLPDYAYGHGAAKGANKVFKEKYPQIKISEIWSPVGTPDFTSYIIKVKEAKPDVVMMGHWGNDAINVLKQAYELGLRKETKIFYNSIGYTLASGVPADALDGVTMGWWWYHDLSGLKDQATENAANELRQKYFKEYGDIPDTFATYTYISFMETIRGVQAANSADPAKVYKAIMDKPDFAGPKGPAKWRVDGRPDFKYGYFIVDGKGSKARKDKYDIGKVVEAYQGPELCLPLKEMGW
ncbi:MAG TPA: ABC transporter substrate-binding protein [Thermodesulfobacteriota bacterium]|nr:ABC transporter substrate-binding protein [Thermodesulfobacteriota bacterium]